jgi:hypothetical protein
MRRQATAATAAVMLVALGGPARANLIVNGGFEDPVLAVGSAVVFTPGQAIGAWTVLGDPGTNVALGQTAYNEPFNDNTLFNAQEGLNELDITGTFNQGPSAGVEQSVATVPGQSYTLSFYVGRATPCHGPAAPYATPATVDLSIDGGARLSFTNPDVINGMVDWKPFSLTFTAVGNSTAIAFLNGTAIGNNYAGLDNVVLVPGAVPEPTSLAMLGIGSTAMLLWSAARRRASAASAAVRPAVAT